MTIGETIRKYRLAAGMTQQQVGEAIGLKTSHRQRLSDWETGGRVPSPRHLLKLMAVLKIPPEAFDEFKNIKNLKGEKTMKKYQVVGLYLEDELFKAVKAEFYHENEEELADIESAMNALLQLGNKNYFAIYCQNSNGHYIGISTKTTSENHDAFYRNYPEEYRIYKPDYSAGYTDDMAAEAILKLL